MPTAQLEWSLNIECPHCEENNDLADSIHDTESRIAKMIFANEWDKLREWDVTCQHCKKEFKLDFVEY